MNRFYLLFFPICWLVYDVLGEATGFDSNLLSVSCLCSVFQLIFWKWLNDYTIHYSKVSIMHIKKSNYASKSTAAGKVRRTSRRRDAWRDSLSAEAVSVGAL